MKKVILCLVVAATVLFAQQANAQETQASSAKKGFYFKINGGYNFAASNSQHSTGETPIAIFPYPLYNGTENLAGDIEWEVVDVNLGKGFNFGETVGYMFNSRFGAELEVDYTLGAKTETKVKALSGDYFKQSLTSNMVQFKPAFVLSAGYSKLNPYVKLGGIVGLGKIKQEVQNKSGIDLNEVEAEAKGGVAFGYHAGIGISYGITSNLSLFGEVNMNSLSYTPTEGKLTKYTVNGVDELPTLNTSQKEYDYIEGNPYLLAFGGGATIDPTKPLRSPKTSYNYNTIGINIGVKYSL